MKNIAKSIFVLLGVLAVSCSTDDVQDRPVIEGVAAPVLSALYFLRAIQGDHSLLFQPVGIYFFLALFGACCEGNHFV